MNDFDLGDADALGKSGHGTPSPSLPTPGPWTLAHPVKPPAMDQRGDIAIVAHGDPKDHLIAEVFHRTGETTWQPVEANARLIAAAPDLLAALQGLNRKRLDGKDGYCVCSFIDGTDAPRHSGTCREARAALAKATGQP